MAHRLTHYPESQTYPIQVLINAKGKGKGPATFLSFLPSTQFLHASSLQLHLPVHEVTFRDVHSSFSPSTEL